MQEYNKIKQGQEAIKYMEITKEIFIELLDYYNESENLKKLLEEYKENEKKILEETLTFAEAAELVGVTAAHFTYLVKTNKLIEGKDFRRAGRIYLIRKKTVLELFNRT